MKTDTKHVSHSSVGFRRLKTKVIIIIIIANTVCWNIDIFNKDRILLMHISLVFSCNFLFLVLLFRINDSINL
jgi:hypothetical protein